MRRIIDRILVDPIIQCWAAGIIAFSAHRWWTTGEGLILLFLLVLGCSTLFGAMDREVRRAEWQEPGDGRPAWWQRVVGHPVVALPVILPLAAIISVTGYSAWIDRSVPVDGVLFATLGVFATPLVLLCRWTLCRHRWKQRQPRAASSGPKAKPMQVSTASVVLPTMELGSASIPDAMAALPDDLLKLVRDGAATVRAAQDRQHQ
jgi:hypothetical protein